MSDINKKIHAITDEVLQPLLDKLAELIPDDLKDSSKDGVTTKD